MKVYKAPTTYRKNKIEGLTKHPNKIEFIKDINGNWIISNEVINDPKFNHLKSEFEFLEPVEYSPIVVKDLD